MSKDFLRIGSKQEPSNGDNYPTSLAGTASSEVPHCTIPERIEGGLTLLGLNPVIE